MNRALISKYVFILNIIIHFAVGICLIVFSNESFDHTNYFIGSVIILTALPNLFIYFIDRGYRFFIKQPYLVFAVVSVFIGVIFILCPEIEPIHMCLIWGIHDIIRSAYEIFDGIREFRESKLELLEIIAGIADLTLGILLVIEREQGIKMHIITMGIALIVVGVRFLIELIFKIKQGEM